MTTTTTHRVHGVIGAVDTDTDDGRRIARSGLVLPSRYPIPLMGLRRDPQGHHAGSEVIGQLDRIVLVGRELHAEGTADGVDPGEYPCGLDLADVTSSLIRPDGAMVTEDDLFADDEDDTVQVLELVTAGRVLGVTVYLAGGRGSFPDARLVVTA